MNARALTSYLPFKKVALLFAGGAAASIFPGCGGVLAAAIVLASLAVAALCAAGTMVALARRRWRLAAQRGARALLILPAIPMSLWAGDYIHVAVLYPLYAKAIAERGQTRFVWGDAAIFVTDGLRLRTLVYDPKGDSPIWPGEEGVRVSRWHLVGAFYIEEEDSE